MAVAWRLKHLLGGTGVVPLREAERMLCVSFLCTRIGLDICSSSPPAIVTSGKSSDPIKDGGNPTAEVYN